MKNISKPARDSSRRINSPLADITLSTWVPILFLAFVFFLGGGSRSDIASLPVLRGAAVLFAFWAALQMRREDWRRVCIPLSLIDRKSVVSGKSVSVRVDIGGSCILKK